MRLAGKVLLVLAGATVIAGALVALAYQGDLGHALKVAARGGQMIDTAAGPIEYAEHGTGYPLLSIHGAGGGYDQGLANVAELVGDSYHVIAPSRFGYLGTPIPADKSPAAQADAHVALLDALRIDAVIVVGTSAGARSALELAIRNPERVSALVLLVPGTYAPDSAVRIEESRGSAFAFWLVNAGADFFWWATEKVAPSMLIRFIGVDPGFLATLPQEENDRVMKIVDSILPLSLRFPGINIDSIPDLHPLPLEQINTPTLVISARDDLFNTAPAAEFAAAGIPNAKLVIYDTGGHLLAGRGHETRPLIQQFIATVVGANR